MSHHAKRRPRLRAHACRAAAVPSLAAQIRAAAVAEDAADGLGGGRLPLYAAGVRDGWEASGEGAGRVQGGGAGLLGLAIRITATDRQARGRLQGAGALMMRLYKRNVVAML